MINNKPYFLKSFYQWAIDSALTPVLEIDTRFESYKSSIPKSYISADGKIDLDISKNSAKDLEIDNKRLHFFVCLSGTSHEVTTGIDSIINICIKETSEIMRFNDGCFKKIVINDYVSQAGSVNPYDIYAWLKENQKKWIDKMCLNEWHINTYVVDEKNLVSIQNDKNNDDEGNHTTGDCQTLYEYKTATIRLYSKHIKDEKELERVFVHELAHVATACINLYDSYFFDEGIFSTERRIARNIKRHIHELIAIQIEDMMCGKDINRNNIVDNAAITNNHLTCCLNSAGREVSHKLISELNPETKTNHITFNDALDSVLNEKKFDPDFWYEKYSSALNLKLAEDMKNENKEGYKEEQYNEMSVIFTPNNIRKCDKYNRVNLILSKKTGTDNIE